MFCRSRRALPSVAICVVLLIMGAGSERTPAFDPDPPDAIVIRPPTGVGSGTGSFEYLDQAIDTNISNGSIGSVQVACRDTCLNQIQKSAEWQGFPDGFEPLRLEIRWDAVGGISLAAGRTSRVDLKLEYNLGGGWETAAEEAWISEIPSCSEVYKSRCANNTFVLPLVPGQSTAAIKVRATAKAEMTACGNCGLFDTSHMLAIMAVRNIQVVARGPRLVAEPGYTVTRGDTVTFRVVGAPVTSFSNWRYEPTGHPAIVRSENINTDSWEGPLVLGGMAKVVVIVPGQQSSISLQLRDGSGTPRPMTVNPRAWNSLPLAPQPKTGLAPPPGIFSAATNLPGAYMGYFRGYFSAVHTSLKLGGDTPNKGLTFVTEVKHDTDPLAWFGYEISPELEPGTTFYGKQCGQGGFILGSVLRTNTYEHESGTVKGHYQQYRDKLAEPAVNFAKYAENRIGPVAWTKQQFDDDLQDDFDERRQTLTTTANVEACNSDVRYDVTCPAPGSFRGYINYPPYAAPCQ